MQFVMQCCAQLQDLLCDFGCAGGEKEAEAAYDEAVHAIFELQLERHRHVQPYISKKDGRSKWAMIEMSPMMVSPARACVPMCFKIAMTLVFSRQHWR